MCKRAVVAYGRMAPPTIGHALLVQKLAATAKDFKGDPILFLTHSYDGKDAARPALVSRNPLKYQDKVLFARDAFETQVEVREHSHKNVFSMLASLEAEGYDEVTLVGDRHFLSIDFEKYNHKNYSFKSINTVVSGERGENHEDPLAQVSATRVREAVMRGDYDRFTSLVATRTLTRELWNKLREEMRL